MIFRSLTRSSDYDRIACSHWSSQEVADEALCALEFEVSHHGNFYPIMEFPDVRHVSSRSQNIGISFRLLPDDRIELIEPILVNLPSHTNE